MKKVIYEPPQTTNFNAMQIQYNTDREILIEVSNIFNKKNNVASAYRLLDTYLRHECGLDEWEVDDVVDRLEEQVTEHIIEIIESKQA